MDTGSSSFHGSGRSSKILKPEATWIAVEPQTIRFNGGAWIALACEIPQAMSEKSHGYSYGKSRHT